MKDYNKNTNYHLLFIRYAIFFLVRGGKFNEEQAKFEIGLIKEKIGLEDFLNGFGGRFVHADYIRMTRIGANVRLNRQDRIEVALTLDRAAEHALFEFLNGKID